MSITDGWDPFDEEWMQGHSPPDPQSDTNNFTADGLKRLSLANRGEKNPGAKLKEAEVLDIFERAWSGEERTVDIAADYGITDPLVSMIKHGKKWGWLTENLAQSSR